jgi:hypothetical protein
MMSELLNPFYQVREYQSYLVNWEYYRWMGQTRPIMDYLQYWRFCFRWDKEYPTADWDVAAELEWLACA